MPTDLGLPNAANGTAPHPASTALPQVSPDVARQAAQWLVRMEAASSGPSSIAQSCTDACARWRAERPEHEHAWQRALRFTQPLRSLPPQLARPAASALMHGGAPPGQRRAVLRAVLLACCASPVAWMGWRSAPVRERLAQHRTAVGERRLITLQDGGSIHLNTASAVDLDYSDSLRLVLLHAGEIRVQTAPDTAHSKATDGLTRPFVVQTPQGRIRALGTRFTVRLRDGGVGIHAGTTHVAVQEGAVEIIPDGPVWPGLPDRFGPGNTAAVTLQAGEQTTFSRQQAAPPQAASPQADAWTHGVLLADRLPLGQFVAELARYRSGPLHCDASVATLPISGAFQLAHVDAVLKALPATLPVQLVLRGDSVRVIAPDAAR